MIRVLFLLLFTSVFTLSKGQVKMYQVSKIKTVRKYYVIYATKNDTIYKIISKKDKLMCGTRIRKNESYPFQLARIEALGGPEVDCFSFDRKTVFCKEPEVELMLANNVKGLCLIEP